VKFVADYFSDEIILVSKISAFVC